jgi:hypothetical protein
MIKAVIIGASFFLVLYVTGTRFLRDEIAICDLQRQAHQTASDFCAFVYAHRSDAQK